MRARPASSSPVAPSAPASAGWRLALAAAWGVLALALLPLMLPAAPGEAVRGAFHLVCHQLPQRSFVVGGGVAGVCHRCTGLLLGLALGLALRPLAVWTRPLASRRRALVLGALALAPLAADWALGAAGLWVNAPLSRVLTGSIFGGYAGVVLGAALQPSSEGAERQAPCDAVVFRATE